MADNKYRYPPAPPNGRGTFSDNLVGLQVVQGGGLTQGNFEFSTNLVERIQRNFDTGVFSQPLSLTDINSKNIEENKILFEKEFRVYPNYDISQITNFTLYGSIQKRISTSVTKIVNYFPAALEVDKDYYDYTTGNTAYDITYDNVENTTTFKINVRRLKNPFDIDYSVNASRNLQLRPIQVSNYRNLTNNYTKYSLYFSDVLTEYRVLDFEPSSSLVDGYIEFTVQGKPFGNETETTTSLVIKPNDDETEKIFKEAFDEVEDFLLNRKVSPKYSAVFQVIKETEDGKLYKTNEKVVWLVNKHWNLDITTSSFDRYLEKLSEIALDIDDFRTDLISRFLTAGTLKDFDTQEQKFEKVLQIYGRSFDETKKFIDALSNMNSVNYTVKNDIPSQLLSNLAQTLGWDTNISPISNENFIANLIKGNKVSAYSGQSIGKTPNELNQQYYRNLILNSAYLFKSKGTRRSIEALMNLIGAPKALIEFNETLYLADGVININDFDSEFALLSGGTKVEQTVTLDPDNTFMFMGQEYSGFTTTTSFSFTDTERDDYPIDINGYPKKPLETDDMFFQKGSGWYETTPEHRSIEVVNITNSVFTGQNVNIQTQLETKSFGEKYFNRFRNFPYMKMGYNISRVYDNKKSWADTETDLRTSKNAGYNAYYQVDDEKLVLNSKNIELSLNMGQGILYDIWNMSKKYDYPIPSTGLTSPYPYPEGADWTIINPKPKEKTFFEFAQTFYLNMINVRDRLFIDDGKGGGYPTLQSLYWRYINSLEEKGIESNKYTYQKMIDFTNGIGDYWMKLVEQMIPATTLWMGGQKFENNVLQRQKISWKRQRGCVSPLDICIPCTYNGSLFNYNCATHTLSCNISQSLQTVLTNSIVTSVQASGFTYSDCVVNGTVSEWYLLAYLDGVELLNITTPFYTGFGPNDFPSQTQWVNEINAQFPNLQSEGIGYEFNGNSVTIFNLTCDDDFENKTFKIGVGVNISILCEE
jgi:hypothetical protein